MVVLSAVLWVVLSVILWVVLRWFPFFVSRNLSVKLINLLLLTLI